MLPSVSLQNVVFIIRHVYNFKARLLGMAMRSLVEFYPKLPEDKVIPDKQGKICKFLQNKSEVICRLVAIHKLRDTDLTIF